MIHLGVNVHNHKYNKEAEERMDRYLNGEYDIPKKVNMKDKKMGCVQKELLRKIAKLSYDKLNDFLKKISMSNIPRDQKDELLDAVEERMKRSDRSSALVEGGEVKPGEV